MSLRKKLSLCVIRVCAWWVNVWLRLAADGFTSPEVAKYVPPLKLLTEVSKFCLKTACNVLREDILYVDFSEIIDFSKFLHRKDFAKSGTSESIQPEESHYNHKKKKKKKKKNRQILYHFWRRKTRGNENQSCCTARSRRNCNAWSKNSLGKPKSSHKPKKTTSC